MKKFLTAIVLIAALTKPLAAEYVFLKDGQIIKGRIVTDRADSITVVGDDNKTKVIPRGKIMRILYTEFYMGKIFVHKIDGSVIEAYMVDEDKDTFTFRLELNKPVEFVLKRDEVLFTTRTNPVGLKGKAKNDSIAIEWQAPYTPVKHYRVYVKSGKDYKLYSEPWMKSEKIKGLKSNTLYKIKVTAIDKEGIESMPSNEITITTPNIPPEPPVKMKLTRKTDPGGKKMTVSLTWDSTTDIDGKIKEYKIYRKDKGSYSLIGTSVKNEFTVKNLDAETVHYFYVTAVDDLKAESGKSKVVNTYDFLGYNISVKPEYIIPLGKFKDVHKWGAGALVCAEKENVLFEGFILGAELGYWQFQGADSETSETDFSMMLPFAVTLGYRIGPFAGFSIIPRIAIGGSFNYMAYKSEPELYTGYGLDKEKKTKWSVEPLVMAGLELNFDITSRIYLLIAGDAGAVIEKSGLMPFVSATAGAGMRF